MRSQKPDDLLLGLNHEDWMELIRQYVIGANILSAIIILASVL